MVLTRGKKQRDDLYWADLVQSLSLLFPERRRLAQRMASDATMTSEERWLAMEDLYTLCTRDFSVLPSLPPASQRALSGKMLSRRPRRVSGAKVSDLVALTNVPSLLKNQRNQHIQACSRREIASKREHLQTDVHYCHQCFNWVVGPEEWEEHCQSHINDLGSKRCGTITYCHTLVHPAYCPLCLETQRFESWCRDHALWQHVDKHLQRCKWPRTCPHPLCDMSLSDGLNLRFHFIDEHGLSRTIPKDAKNLGTTRSCPEEDQVSLTKRKTPEDSLELSWPSPEQFSPTHPPKKVKQHSSTIAPLLLSNMDADTLCPTPLTDLTGSDSSTYAPESTPSLGTKEDRWSENRLESGIQSPVRFRSYESTVVDDDVFSRFIQSPSPDDVPTTSTVDQDRQAVVDIDDLVSPSNISFSEASLLHHDSEPNGPLDVPMKTCPKLRIHLRVEPPKTKIKLRVSAPQRSESDKQLCPPKRCKGTRRQRPQRKRKKTATRRW